MGNLEGDAIPCAVVIMILTMSIGILAEAPTAAAEAGGTRATTDRYYMEGQFYIPAGWDRDSMYITVFLQNRDREDTTDVFGQGSYQTGMMANSYQFPMDGSPHSSGEKKRALLELITDTDCFYCPGADAAVHRIAEGDMFPDDISIVEWHMDTTGEADPFDNSYSRGRASYYGITGTPSAIIDGRQIAVGGDPSWNNKEIDALYLTLIDRTLDLPPIAAFAGRGWFEPSGEDYTARFNLSVEVIDAIPRGNWTLTAALCEDMIDPVTPERSHRFTNRYAKAMVLEDLFNGAPTISIDDKATLGNDVDVPVRGNVTVRWSANDPEDGTELTIGIGYQSLFGGQVTIATGLTNTGTYRWNTLDPRPPDGIYQLYVVATDGDGNKVSDYTRLFILDNLDVPLLNITYPSPGESISGRYDIRWDSSDDEDERIDLKAKVSISGDGGTTWEPLTYTGPGNDYEVDDGHFDFNTAAWPDGPAYHLRIEVLDTSGMRAVRTVGPIEIYNNDPPTVKIVGPTQVSVNTGNVTIEYKLSDQEDGPEGLHLRIEVARQPTLQWTAVFNGTPEALDGSITVPTSGLQGDGDYSLRLTVVDSRGRSNTANGGFKVYDPDAPSIQGILLPEGPISGSFVIGWNASDPDAGEVLTAAVWVREADGTEWTPGGAGLGGAQATIAVDDLADGIYEVKVRLTDSSQFRLFHEVEAGTVEVDNPQGPDVSFRNPAPGFRGTIDNRTLQGYIMRIEWECSDPDGGPISYGLEYRVEGSVAWLPLLEEGSDVTVFRWNVSKLEDGMYSLRITATDPTGMSDQMTIGPFTINVPEPYVPVKPPRNDSKGGNGTSELGLGGFLIGGGVVLVLVVLGAVIAIVVLSLTRKKKVSTPAIPKPEEVDLSVPDFERL